MLALLALCINYTTVIHLLVIQQILNVSHWTPLISYLTSLSSWGLACSVVITPHYPPTVTVQKVRFAKHQDSVAMSSCSTPLLTLHLHLSFFQCESWDYPAPKAGNYPALKAGNYPALKAGNYPALKLLGKILICIWEPPLSSEENK